MIELRTVPLFKLRVSVVFSFNDTQMNPNTFLKFAYVESYSLKKKLWVLSFFPDPNIYTSTDVSYIYLDIIFLIYIWPYNAVWVLPRQ